ncbi:MAG: HPr family phosphocarrier protein [Alkalispirochaeta sp.]|jgi:phosphotransferase system HPr (HPr) family protein
MIQKNLSVLNEEGLHTRPANEFVRIVKGFEAVVTLTKGEREVPGKSLLKIMKLGIVTGDEVTITCDGSDEEAAMEALVRLVQPGGTA